LTVAGGVSIGSGAGYVNTAASANGMSIQGNVGLGTFVSPIAALAVRSGNVGIGTITPQASFVVTNGNVGIGTWSASGGSLIVMGGNVGIGSRDPQGTLDMGTAGTFSWPAQKSSSGTRYLCIDTNGVIASSASVCSGT
jgi:hypothetical protein